MMAYRELGGPQLKRKVAMRTGIGAIRQPILSDNLDADKLAEVALGLLALTIHDGYRACKGMDWGVMNLLYERGWIEAPKGKAKSVVLINSGLEVTEKLIHKHSGRSPKA